MKKKLRYLILASVVTGGAMLSQQAVAEEDAKVAISGNAGILSDYIFRGIPQDDGVGNGGIDLEAMGFYAGTWVADVGDGVEYDLYAGYIHEWDNLYLGAGYTSYQYSDDFDDEYNEVNFYAGGLLGDFNLDLEYTSGEYNGSFCSDEKVLTKPELTVQAMTPSSDSVDHVVREAEFECVPEGDEYTFLAVTLAYGGAYLTYGDFGDDADDYLGSYFEAGYSMELAGFDLTGAVVHTKDAPIIGTDDDDETEAYISISWGFDVI